MRIERKHLKDKGNVAFRWRTLGNFLAIQEYISRVGNSASNIRSVLSSTAGRAKQHEEFTILDCERAFTYSGEVAVPSSDFYNDAPYLLRKMANNDEQDRACQRHDKRIGESPDYKGLH